MILIHEIIPSGGLFGVTCNPQHSNVMISWTNIGRLVAHYHY